MISKKLIEVKMSARGSHIQVQRNVDKGVAQFLIIVVLSHGSRNSQDIILNSARSLPQSTKSAIRSRFSMQKTR